MARYTGPKVRVSRRLGTNIFENDKGRKALERRPFPPGQHGRTRRRNAGSEYLAQLQEKQKAKYIYGVLERQFRRTYEEANRLQGPTGENLLRLLEQRLDNVKFGHIIGACPQMIDVYKRVEKVAERARSLGFRVDARGPQAFAAFLKDEVERWGGIISAARIQPE